VESRSAGSQRASSKSFSSNLDSILNDALDESLSKLDNEPSTSFSGKSKSQRALPRPSSGLDSLIRQTIDVSELTRDENSGKKRLTVAVDKGKLEKLKTIAKLENSYLKDIMVALIDEYISEYIQEKGLDI
jgi:hypothetical protein